MLIWLTGHTVELASPLTLEDCRHRLKDEMDDPFRLFGKKKIIGRIGDHRLSARKRIRYRNSFQTVLRAGLDEQFGQTRFHCRFSMHPFVIAFMTVWFGFIGLGCLAALIHVAVRSGQSGKTYPTDLASALAGGLIPAGMFVFGIFMVRFCRYLARDEQSFLIDFLQTTVDAKPAETPLS